MIRVLVADDSSTVRALLVALLEEEPDVHVVGEARDGLEVVRLARELKPDVITMDIHMPGLDGFEATREIMIDSPTPIVIVSSAVTDADVGHSLDATRAGALMVLPTPGIGTSEADEQRRVELVSMIRAMAQVKVVRRRGQPRSPAPQRGSRRGARAGTRLVAVAASTGGPAVLQRLLADLPRDFEAPILVVQHIAADFIHGLCRWLNTASALRVRVAQHGQMLEPRSVYLAPDDRHLTLDGSRIVLSDEPAIEGFRPSATALFRSAARSHGGGVVAVILTGMGRDGVDGLRAIRETGGRIIAQDETSSVVFGMPGQAVREGLADFILPDREIGAKLVDLSQRNGT